MEKETSKAAIVEQQRVLMGQDLVNKFATGTDKAFVRFADLGKELENTPFDSISKGVNNLVEEIKKLFPEGRVVFEKKMTIRDYLPVGLLQLEYLDNLLQLSFVMETERSKEPFQPIGGGYILHLDSIYRKTLILSLFKGEVGKRVFVEERKISI